MQSVCSVAATSHLRVAGLAGQAATAAQVDGRSGLGPVLAVGAGGAVVVDLGAPGVCGDDPGGGSPLLQGVRRLDALLDLLACGHSGVGRNKSFT